MKKIGVLDIVLVILVVVGIAANIYAYGFYNKDADGSEASGRPAGTAQTPSDAAKSPAKDEDTPALSATEPPAPNESAPGESAPNESAPGESAPTEPAPGEPVVNTLVYTLGSPNVTVNGQEAAIDSLGSAPLIQDGASMLPLRATYEILGGSIELDSNTGYVSAVFLDTTLMIKTGETDAEINGVVTALSVAPVAKNRTTYVPARSIADALGAELIWDGAARTITLEIPSETLIDVSSLLPPS